MELAVGIWDPPPKLGGLLLEEEKTEKECENMRALAICNLFCATEEHSEPLGMGGTGK